MYLMRFFCSLNYYYKCTHALLYIHVQLQLYVEDFENERNDRIRTVEALERMKLEMSDQTSNFSMLKSSIDLLTKQLNDKEQELQKSHHQVSCTYAVST